jgi:hypothetical protein
VRRLLATSQLPDAAVTDEFRRLLRSAPDDEFRRLLIEDRRWLLEHRRPRPLLSQDRASRFEATSDRAFVTAVRRK